MAARNDQTYSVENRRGRQNGRQSVRSPPAQTWSSNRVASEHLMNLLNPQTPRTADTASSSVDDLYQMLRNLRMSGADIQYDDPDQNNYFMDENAESVGSRKPEATSSPIYGEGTSNRTRETNETFDFFLKSSRKPEATSSPIYGEGTSNRTRETNETFDFFLKSLSSLNEYLSLQTREQLSVLSSIRPSLLHEFLQEVIKVESDQRMRRALRNECAFCKNNGENFEFYSSHALRDRRGRVLCPVLRALRCPRCGATGDRAHTVKYCPTNAVRGLERSNVASFEAFRRSLLRDQQTATPPPSPIK